MLSNGYGFGASDRIAFAANPAFDAMSPGVLGPLLNGGAAVVIEPGRYAGSRSGSRLLMLRHAVTVLWLL